MKRYFNHQVNKAIVIQNLITIESLDITKEFTYPEEKHTFYEFVYVDNGNIHCHLEERDILTKKFKSSFRKRKEWKFEVEDFK